MAVENELGATLGSLIWSANTSRITPKQWKVMRLSTHSLRRKV
ncbi:hypothetical protein SNOG_08654 [Parastagonospora nodorum SN15]|uniref:Uncharacterized protein n=1 Tax=Phaeosphaeria nodorum (strain SN15 / ATCC MYA-4574 / FGSC 10173) TaxID=321614 RepID=Q0UHW0_PHANO|nr:hypothetical protein SNOG_08654 [Parastagonospora nodorum SN15]EAT83822.1 hypothetical protein SNOG_08654 [Parastagonospora nodorum SN15]